MESALTKLQALRTQFGRRARTDKLRLLRKAARCDLADARILRDYHETLLFLITHPDDSETRRVAAAELHRVIRAAEEHTSRSGRGGRRLRDSGIAGTVITSGYSYDLLAWLARRFPGSLEPVWDEGSLGERFDELLPTLVAKTEPARGNDSVSPIGASARNRALRNCSGRRAHRANANTSSRCERIGPFERHSSKWLSKMTLCES